MPRSVYYGPFMPKQRKIAMDNDRKYLANNAYRFDGHDYLAAHLRKRARDRSHTITRELQYLKKNPIHRSPWMSRPKAGANWAFVPKWHRTRQPGYRGSDRQRRGKLFVGNPQDGAYRRIRYHVVKKR